MEHQPPSDVGRVDGAPSCALARLGFGLPKQSGAIMLPGIRIGGSENPQRFSQHAAVAPEVTAILEGSPD